MQRIFLFESLLNIALLSVLLSCNVKEIYFTELEISLSFRTAFYYLNQIIKFAITYFLWNQFSRFVQF